MLKGFPGDFPISNEKNETGIFLRNEIDENVNISLAKRAKITEEIVNIVDVVGIEGRAGKENQNNSLRHVKFSGAPPIEYLTFPDSEYDRSPLNKPSCKWKKYIIYKNAN